MLISYAQNFEDVILWRALKHIEAGFYLDVGAQDPIADSVSLAFYDKGWRGVHVEPTPAFAEKLRVARSDEEVIQAAIGAQKGELTLFAIPETGMSTGDAAVAQRHAQSGWRTTEIRVPCLPLAEVLDRFQDREIHWLKIDVEGMEQAVIESWLPSEKRPWVVVVESMAPASPECSHADWEPFLIGLGYEFVYFDGLNRFFVHQSHPEIKSAFGPGPNYFDNFSLSGTQIFTRKLDEDIGAKAQAIARLEADVSVWKKRTEETETQTVIQLKSELSISEARVKEVNQRILSAHEETARLQHLLGAMQSSKSWRLTAPLRKFNEWRASPVLHSKITAKRLLRAPVRGFADHMLPVVRRNPRLKRLARGILIRFPWLYIRVARLLAARPVPSAVSGVPIELRMRDAPQPTGVFANDPASIPLPAGERVVYFFVDHTIGCPTNTGVQRVSRGFGAALSKAGENVRYVSWDPITSQCVLLSAEQREQLTRWNGEPFGEHERTIYRPAADGFAPVPVYPAGECNWLIVPEVPHITAHAGPVTLPVIGWARSAGLKTAFVFYDAIPLRRHELSQHVDVHARYMREIMLADLVLPISEWSGEDLLAFWRISERADGRTMPQVVPIGLGADWKKNPRNGNAPSDAMILCVGTIDERKNQLALAKAFFAFSQARPDSPWKLVLVGNIDHGVVTDLHDLCRRSGGRILHRGNISDEELDILFERCAFTVFPSVEEGFGLPIVESLSYGKPCICANFGPMGALAQEGGCLPIDTRDISQIEQAIEALTADTGRLAVLTEEARRRKIRTWADYAGEVQSVIDGFSDPNNRVDRILFWVDHTIAFGGNSGIQRVVRQLARSLIENGANVVPVKWDRDGGKLVRPTAAELEFLARWNGPEPSSWSRSAIDDALFDKTWFLMSELPLDVPPAEPTKVVSFCRARGIKMANIFFDAIPWMLRDIYPEAFYRAHFDYMVDLYEYDLILPISKHSRNDLLGFWADYRPDCHLADDKTLAASLPSEFPETARTSVVKQEFGSTVNILCVGTVEPRKNHARMLEAYKIANEQLGGKLRLTIVGSVHSPDDLVVDEVRGIVALDPTIIWEREADDALLTRLYRSCDFTIYPSYKEGFGLPIVESLWHARPCICADFGAMKEVAPDNTCLHVDVFDVNAMAEVIVRLANDTELRERLALGATEARFKTWKEYGREVLCHLAAATPNEPEVIETRTTQIPIAERAAAMSLKGRPKLSLCISTYNRAEWLKAGLANWARQHPDPVEGVELFVCDNASTDHTRDIVEPYLSRPDFTYRCNPRNVGMLGNLRETAHHANGEYVWILGDDDLLMPGAVERVLKALRANPGTALVYLNYAFTRIEDARTILDFDEFFRTATPIVAPEGDRVGPIRDFCARNENFFTAIYTLVFRRDHAIHAYSQDTSGRPFSTMLTCIPTTYHVLHRMMDLPGVWIGEPQLVVNMNVSWMKYAPLWILERIPEVYSLAEMKGAAQKDVDRWRRYTLPAIADHFDMIYRDDPLGNADYLKPDRVVRRFKHVSDFPKYEAVLRNTYARAHADGRNAAAASPDIIFPS